MNRFLISISRRVWAVGLLLLLSAAALPAAEKRVLFIAGAPSHGAGFHEYTAGLKLFQKCLAGVPGLKVEVATDGWPAEASALDGVAAVVVFSDGGPGHPLLQGDRLAVLDRALAGGAGLGLLHYTVEPTLPKGQAEFLRWIGGAFEANWSVNPHWTADFKTLPVHPVTRGVKPFSLRDEWYFQMRFVEGGQGLTPLLTAVPNEPGVTRRPDGDHSGNPAMRAAVARGDAQTVAWAYERPGGGRGFGYTGGHFHKNWGHDDARRLVLNAILWLANMEVPAGGVESTVTDADLQQNLDVKPAVAPKGPAPVVAPTPKAGTPEKK